MLCGEALCNPEDVIVSPSCTHKAHEEVCANCAIPICNECWRYAKKNDDIPKALCNDNIVGYLRKFFLENNVTWLESTIACPLFSGLVTYYIEGSPAERHHLMSEKVVQPRLSYGVRGFFFIPDGLRTNAERLE